MMLWRGWCENGRILALCAWLCSAAKLRNEPQHIRALAARIIKREMADITLAAGNHDARFRRAHGDETPSSAEQSSANELGVL